MKYRNPVIPGFYPDPSVCRAGEDFYLCNSSFEFFPGVPLYHSRDLVHWEQQGYVLTRDSQLPLSGCGTSGGVFAPTIREHNGRFYMITTNVGHMSASHKPLQNFIVYTDDIHGEWSEPVLLDHVGIDPSLFWDDDGSCYYVGTHFDETGVQSIGQFQLNPDTGERLSETRSIWTGTGGKCPEGPHMYRIHGKYYLMIAEGGTEYGHMETIARSDHVWGPFESCPHNPILTHRNLMPSFAAMADPAYVDLQGLGHGDLVEDGSGRWWMVFHGVRPTRSQLHHIGRETMLAPVEWVDGWPVVNGGQPISAVMDLPNRGQEGLVPQDSFQVEADFSKLSELPPAWAYLRNPHRENYRLDGALTLLAGEDVLDGMGSPTFMGVRQRQFQALAETVLDVEEGAEAGLTVFHTNEHHYELIVSRKDGRRQAALRRRACDMVTESCPVPLPDEGAVTLRIRSDKLCYRFYVEAPGMEETLVGEGCSQLLSTEVMAGTFTGCFFGVFCQGAQGSAARFQRFSCRYEQAE